MIWDNFLASLRLMALGMSGIFVFIGIFYGLVLILIKMFPSSGNQAGAVDRSDG